MKINLKSRQTQVSIVLVALFLILVLIQVLPSKVLLQGEVVIRQISVSPRIAGRVEEVLSREGDFVEKGAVIAKIDSPDIIAKSQQARGAAAAAAAQKAKAEKGSREEEIAAAYHLWQKAAAGEDLAQKTYNRVKELFDEGVVSAQKLDEASAQHASALRDKNAAKSRYDMALKGARDEDKAAATATSLQAAGAVSEVDYYVDETTVTAPIKGEISSVVVERGELVAPGLSIVTMLDLDDVWITFNIREDLLKNLSMGKEIEVKIPAIDNKKHKFKITYISKLGDFAIWSATKTRGEFDLKTFEVRAKPVDAMPNLRQGMTVIFKTKK
ncbi:HlyD family secretion protein [Elusimicrobium simillimum]|uniref:HlyD family secretion protein n=1 Tax=Elusimicrobium simillimum TaxID=3143438 RepID=UPI003C704343